MTPSWILITVAVCKIITAGCIAVICVCVSLLPSKGGDYEVYSVWW